MFSVSLRQLVEICSVPLARAFLHLVDHGDQSGGDGGCHATFPCGVQDWAKLRVGLRAALANGEITPDAAV